MSIIKDFLKLNNSLPINRESYTGNTQSALSEIFQEDVNISIYSANLIVKLCLQQIIFFKPILILKFYVIRHKDVNNILDSKIELNNDVSELSKDIELVYIFCSLFNLDRVDLD